MSRLSTEELIGELVARGGAVRPLAAPLWRGLVTVAVLAVVAGTVIVLFGDMHGLSARYAGRHTLMMLETGAMLLTGLVAIIGAFFVSIPGRSRLWLLAPLPSLFAWVGLSGLGCYQDFLRFGAGRVTFGDSMTCLSLLLASGLLIGLPLLLRLGRARPVDPLPVALLGGLGAAAASAFLLQFFHPFTLTVLDLGVHLAGVSLIVAIASISRKRTLASAWERD